MADERPRPKQLGRGLSALLGDDDAEDYASLDTVRQAKTVPLAFLRPNRWQPRRTFDETEIEALAESIRANGILQPILVRRHSEDPNYYEIIAGERRWRAAQKAQLHEAPVIVRDLDDSQALEVALVENIQRQDLNPLEEAQGYRRLMDEFGHTQDALSKAVGKSRSHVANTLRLLNLPPMVQDLIDNGALSAGHARALLSAADPEMLALKVVQQGLNVRQTEKLAQGGRSSARRKAAPPPEKDADTRALERDISELLGLKVTISFDGKGGVLGIHYTTVDQLDEVLHRLTASSGQKRPE